VLYAPVAEVLIHVSDGQGRTAEVRKTSPPPNSRARIVNRCIYNKNQPPNGYMYIFKRRKGSDKRADNSSLHWKYLYMYRSLCVAGYTHEMVRRTVRVTTDIQTVHGQSCCQYTIGCVISKADSHALKTCRY
jgi:hypothetical protein